MKEKILIVVLLISVICFSGCMVTNEKIEWKTYIMYGYLEEWDFYNDTEVNGFILTLDNVSWNDGVKTPLKQHWFSDINYSPIEMDYFIEHNISIRYETNYYNGWSERFHYHTSIKEIKNLDTGVIQMIFTLIYILACLFSDSIHFKLIYLIGAIILDLIFDYPTVKIIYRNKGEEK